MLKTQVELITGFIGAGKTTWIRSFLRVTAAADEKIVVLQLEKGQEGLDLSFKKQGNITYVEQIGEQLTLSYLKNLLILYEPDRLIIECNGIKIIDEMITLLANPDIKKRAVITTVFNLVEATHFKLYWQNLKAVLLPALSMSHMIIVTKTHLIDIEQQQELKHLLEQENKEAHIIFVGEQEGMALAMAECALLDKGWIKSIRLKLRKQFRKLLEYKGVRG